MSTVLVTGSAGLIGSESATFFHEMGYDVAGLDNNMREYFFGKDGATTWRRKEMERSLSRYRHFDIDIRDVAQVEGLFRDLGRDLEVIIHAAAQPSHDWAAREPHTDFAVNANGTLNLLEATRRYCPEAAFAFTSTNKVYGDTPNRLPLKEMETRWELDPGHPYAEHGVDESMSIDHSLHSLFGVSKLAADVMVQEYGRYFGMNTAVFRGGCLTGPAHSGARLHGFLAYLVKCAVRGEPYTIYGYKGKQVRDNIHSRDMVRAFWSFARAPRPAAVYNIGGGRHSNCSVLEAITMLQEMLSRPINATVSDRARQGDHIWWITDIRRFRNDYPDWDYEYDLDRMLREIVAASGAP